MKRRRYWFAGRPPTMRSEEGREVEEEEDDDDLDDGGRGEGRVVAVAGRGDSKAGHGGT